MQAVCQECGKPLTVETLLHEDDVIVVYVVPCEECLKRTFEDEYYETLSDREKNKHER